MRVPALGVILAAAVLAGGCDDTPAGPTVPLDQRFTLAPGETATVEGASLRVAFLRVSGDSRCPADAICIQGGDAIVHIRASDGASAEYELHTGDSGRASAMHAGFRIRLEELQPYPFSSQPPIVHDDYRATFTVSR